MKKINTNVIKVLSLEYECYTAMAESEMQKIILQKLVISMQY